MIEESHNFPRAYCWALGINYPVAAHVRWSVAVPSFKSPYGRRMMVGCETHDIAQSAHWDAACRNSVAYRCQCADCLKVRRAQILRRAVCCPISVVCCWLWTRRLARRGLQLLEREARHGE